MASNGETESVKRSASFLDVKTVEKGHSTHPVKKSKLSSVCSLLESKKAVQEHENEIAETVIVCEPEQASLMMGGLHPRGSLYERPVNIDTAKAQHAEFRNQLRAHGVRVLTVREILAYNVGSCKRPPAHRSPKSCYAVTLAHTARDHVVSCKSHHRWSAYWVMKVDEELHLHANIHCYPIHTVAATAATYMYCGGMCS